MNTIGLSAGTVEYTDTGEGPVLVLLHGLMMDASLWDGVVAELSSDHRCVAPTLPFGAHRRPVRPGTDLTLPGLARLVTEFLDRLDLRDVTLVGSDTGGALVQLVLAEGAGPRVGRAVLASCEAFENFPARVTGTALALSGRLPPWLFGLFMQQMRVRAVRRLPVAFGWLTGRGDVSVRRWLEPVLTRPDIRRDTVRLLRASARANPLPDAALRLPGFDRPALVVWAKGDRVMPPEHGRRLAGLLPQGRLVEVDGTRTLIPLDRPDRFAGIVREFTRASSPAPG